MVGMNVIEDEALIKSVAAEIKAIGSEIGMPIVFKASFDKANRSSIHSYRGLGMTGTCILADIKESLPMPIFTDIHEPYQQPLWQKRADIIQILICAVKPTCYGQPHRPIGRCTSRRCK